MRTVRINVTMDHITKGERDNCESCPVALAMLAAGLHRPRVWLMGLEYGPVSHRREVAIPDEVRAFIDAFDIGRPVDPFSFDVEEP